MTATPSVSVRHFVLVHRRLLAAAFAALAVWSALGAMRPGVEGAPVVIARHDLAAGAAIGASDLRVATFPAAARPEHSWQRVDQLLGRRVAAPMRAGEPITDFRLLTSGLLKGYPKGTVLSTIRIADGSQLAGLQVGDHVDVVGTDPQADTAAVVLSHRAEIVSLPQLHGSDDAALTVAIGEAAALRLAAARLRAQLGVVAVS